MHPLPPPPLPLPPPQVDKLLDQQQLLLGMLSSGATLGPPATGAQPGVRGEGAEATDKGNFCRFPLS